MLQAYYWQPKQFLVKPDIAGTNDEFRQEVN